MKEFTLIVQETGDTPESLLVGMNELGKQDWELVGVSGAFLYFSRDKISPKLSFPKEIFMRADPEDRI